MPYQTLTIKSNREIAPGIRSMAVPWKKHEQPDIRAGQFFMLRAPGSAALLPRAISVCDWDGTDLHFCYQVVGRGTGELSRLIPGADLSLTGPLGNGFPLDALGGRVALVGGGIGAAPMVLTAKALRERGVAADCLLGFRDIPFLHRELAGAAEVLRIATESGQAGTKGFVTALLDPARYDAVLCCGPEPMMKAVTALCMRAGTPVYVSVENRMACGVGGCLVCTCTGRDGHNRRACQDGPVFRGEEIDFDA